MSLHAADKHRLGEVSDDFSVLIEIVFRERHLIEAYETRKETKLLEQTHNLF